MPFAVWFALCCLAPPPAALPASLTARLTHALDAPALATGFTGALVVAAGTRSDAALQQRQFGLLPYDDGQRPELFASNADKAFTPASNQKLLTAAAALDVLGSDYHFRTAVVAPAEPRDGTVEALTLVGGGDPSLAYDDLTNLARAVKAAGVTAVSGDIFGDGSRYPGLYPEGWTTDDLVWYYAPEVTALSLARNHVDVLVMPTTAGRAAKVWFSPANSYVQLAADVLTTRAGGARELHYDRPPDSPRIIVSGTIPAGGDTASEGVSIGAVEAYAATVFRDALVAAGVTVKGQARAGTAPPHPVELAQHASPALGELLQRLLKRSDNLYAELCLRELGVAAGGRGTVEDGLRAVREFLERHQISQAGLRLADGSGLSRYDLVTPRTIAGVLRTMAFHRERVSFFDALPLAGVDGTLRLRMVGTAANRRVRAKTGYLSNHTALSGYVTTRGGDLLIAATLFNHFLGPTREAREAHDAFFAALADWRR